MNYSQLIIEQLINLLTEVKNELTSEDVENIIEFIENNEYGLAFETLCTQLYEYNIQISCEFYEKLASYGNAIQIPSPVWLPLKRVIPVK